MNAGAVQPADPVRLDRALDRLAEHCELVVRRSAHLEERRSIVRAHLESELGPELTSVLLTGLASALARSGTRHPR